jgi:hypothetical protein
LTLVTQEKQYRVGKENITPKRKKPRRVQTALSTTEVGQKVKPICALNFEQFLIQMTYTTGTKKDKENYGI